MRRCATETAPRATPTCSRSSWRQRLRSLSARTKWKTVLTSVWGSSFRSLATTRSAFAHHPKSLSGTPRSPVARSSPPSHKVAERRGLHCARGRVGLIRAVLAGDWLRALVRLCADGGHVALLVSALPDFTRVPMLTALGAILIHLSILRPSSCHVRASDLAVRGPLIRSYIGFGNRHFFRNCLRPPPQCSLLLQRRRRISFRARKRGARAADRRSCLVQPPGVSCQVRRRRGQGTSELVPQGHQRSIDGASGEMPCASAASSCARSARRYAGRCCSRAQYAWTESGYFCFR